MTHAPCLKAIALASPRIIYDDYERVLHSIDITVEQDNHAVCFSDDFIFLVLLCHKNIEFPRK